MSDMLLEALRHQWATIADANMARRIIDEARMKYRDTWDLATIPEIELKREWGRRNGLKGGRPIEPAADKATEEARRTQREYRRQRRAEGKDK